MTDDRAATHEAIYALLAELDRICTKYRLVWCAANGTLLGAARHAGVVPWDADADVWMPRPDYDLLLDLAPEELGARFVLQTPESDPGSFYGGHARLLDAQGVWLDILPLDWVGDVREMWRVSRRVRHLQRLLLAKTYPDQLGLIPDANPRRVSLYYLLAPRVGRGLLCRMLHDACLRHSGQDALVSYASYRPWAPIPRRYPADLMEGLRRVPFGPGDIPVPREAEAILAGIYGEDWTVPKSAG